VTAITRRGFLAGLCALAATAVVSPECLIQAPKSDIDRFMEMARTGTVMGMTFYFDGPVDLTGLPPLRIEGCNIVISGLSNRQHAIKINSGIQIHNSIIKIVDNDQVWRGDALYPAEGQYQLLGPISFDGGELNIGIGKSEFYKSHKAWVNA